MFSSHPVTFVCVNHRTYRSLRPHMQLHAEDCHLGWVLFFYQRTDSKSGNETILLITWWFEVAFLVCVSDLQLGDNKATLTLNHLAVIFLLHYIPSLPNTFWVGVWTPKKHLQKQGLIYGGSKHLYTHNVFGWFWKTRDMIVSARVWIGKLWHYVRVVANWFSNFLGWSN